MGGDYCFNDNLIKIVKNPRLKTLINLGFLCANKYY
jgi:hypothetical protein